MPEIRLRRKYLNRSGAGRKGKGSGNSGASRPKLVMRPGEREAAQALTVANARVAVLTGGTHRRVVKASELADFLEREEIDRLIRRHFADGHAHPDGRCPYDSPLDEVLDRIDRRRGGKIGFEEAVDIIESERNNAEPPDASLPLQSAGASRRAHQPWLLAPRRHPGLP